MQRVGRYIVAEAIGKGGMATVHLARMVGPSGFGRILAVKRLHPHLVNDSELVVMLLDEAKLAARIQSPFVVQTLDVVADKDELVIVMEYVHGVSLHRLLQRTKDKGELADPASVSAIMHNVLSALHVAHELHDAEGVAMDLVHRDVSPQNILVGADGVARLLDFGVARALGRVTTTREGHVKGKISYMSPEQLEAQPVDRRTDVFAASVVFWEALTGKRLFGGEDERTTIGKILSGVVPKPSDVRPELDPALDAVILKGLARDPDDRFPTAKAMATALEGAITAAPSSKIGRWVETLCGAELDDRKRAMIALERTSGPDLPRGVEEDETKSAQTLGVVTTSRRRSGRFAPWIVVLAIGALAIGTSLWLRERGSAATSVASATASVAPSASETSSQIGTAAASVASAGLQPDPKLAVASSAPAASSATSVPSVNTTRAGAARPSASAQASAGATAPPVPSAKPPDCTNPYELDAQGRRRYRRECLGSN